MKQGVSLVAAACVVGLGWTFAAEPTAGSTTSSVKPGSSAEAAPIPESIEKLNLTTKQQERIREIGREYDESINSVWNQYRDRYMQTLVAETSLLAAVEDGLTDAQRDKIRAHRRGTAQLRKAANATVKSENAASDKVDPIKDKPDGELQAEAQAVGVTLTKDQETSADKVHQKYRSHLRSLNREIHSLHTRLLALEADKLAEMESVLTKEQLIQLRANRQNAPESTKLTIGQVTR